MMNNTLFPDYAKICPPKTLSPKDSTQLLEMQKQHLMKNPFHPQLGHLALTRASSQKEA